MTKWISLVLTLSLVGLVSIPDVARADAACMIKEGAKGVSAIAAGTALAGVGAFLTWDLAFFTQASASAALYTAYLGAFGSVGLWAPLVVFGLLGAYGVGWGLSRLSGNTLERECS